MGRAGRTGLLLTEPSDKAMPLTCLQTVMWERKLLTDTEAHENCNFWVTSVQLTCILLPVSSSFHCLSIYILLQLHISFFSCFHLGHEHKTLLDKIFRYLVHGSNLSRSFGILTWLVSI